VIDKQETYKNVMPKNKIKSSKWLAAHTHTHPSIQCIYLLYTVKQQRQDL